MTKQVKLFLRLPQLLVLMMNDYVFNCHISLTLTSVEKKYVGVIIVLE